MTVSRSYGSQRCDGRARQALRGRFRRHMGRVGVYGGRAVARGPEIFRAIAGADQLPERDHRGNTFGHSSITFCAPAADRKLIQQGRPNKYHFAEGTAEQSQFTDSGPRVKWPPGLPSRSVRSRSSLSRSRTCGQTRAHDSRGLQSPWPPRLARSVASRCSSYCPSPLLGPRVG
jgi:hypothetical protein